MTTAITGFVLLVLFLMLAKRLGLALGGGIFVLAFLAGLLFFASFVFEGVAISSGEREVIPLVIWCAACGWLVLLITVAVAAGELGSPARAETRDDPEIEEYLAFREERKRHRMRERLEEADRTDGVRHPPGS